MECPGDRFVEGMIWDGIQTRSNGLIFFDMIRDF